MKKIFLGFLLSLGFVLFFLPIFAEQSDMSDSNTIIHIVEVQSFDGTTTYIVEETESSLLPTPRCAVKGKLLDSEPNNHGGTNRECLGVDEECCLYCVNCTVVSFSYQ